MEIILILMLTLCLPGTVLYYFINGNLCFLKEIGKLKEWSIYTMLLLVLGQTALYLVASEELIAFEHKGDVTILFMLGVNVMAAVIGILLRIVMNSNRKSQFIYSYSRKRIELEGKTYEVQALEKSTIFKGRRCVVCYCMEKTIGTIDTQADIVILEDQSISEDILLYIAEHIRPRYILANKLGQAEERMKQVLEKANIAIKNDFEQDIELFL